MDWIIVIIYAFSVIIMGWCLGKRQKGVDDYFLAGRSLPWWAIGISTMATQLSAISFISAPAFVGLRPGGGLVWLGYEFAVPFALIPLMHRIIPTFHQLRIISIYQYLEFRFNKATRRFVSIIFQISRALATGVGIYAGAIVMSVALEIPLFFTICLIGIIALIYDYMGGMRAVVFSDVLQMLILFIGIIICMVFGLHYIGGWQAVGNLIPPERLSSFRLDQFGVGSRENFGFLPLFFGGFFLYIARLLRFRSKPGTARNFRKNR